MDIKQSKVECKVRFPIFNRDMGSELSEKWFDGLFSMFTHRYNHQIAFWYGVVDVSCNMNEYGKVTSHRNLFLELDFMNGRVEQCDSLGSEYKKDLIEDTEHFQFFIFGKCTDPPIE